jgi:hypothetical protein
MTTVWIIRHCDKPPTGDVCNKQGYLRARLLAGLTGRCAVSSSMCNNACVGTFSGGFWDRTLQGHAPTAIYAAVPTAINSLCTDTSNRMCLIMDPTAQSYGMEVNGDGALFCDTDNVGMAQWIESNNPTGDVLVAWEHTNIPHLITALGVNCPVWPHTARNRFDLVFRVDMITRTLSISTQNLKLSGDSPILPAEYAQFGCTLPM